MFEATKQVFATREEADEYNRRNREAKQKWGGCLSTFCCEQCYTVIHDSICCCIAAVGGGYDCPKCGHSKRIVYQNITFENTSEFSIYRTEQ